MGPRWWWGATGAADVMEAVRFAAARGMPVAVQATRHGPSVPADGAVFINTQRMTGVRVDAAAATVRIAAGVRGGSMVHEAAAHGLAPLNGSAPDVGAISYVLAGGVAMLGRRFGYAADHVRQIDVVTADGQLRQVSAEREPDLFWALRGSRGNHGVVVSLEMDLFPVERLFGGGMYFGADATPDVLRLYRAWSRTCPSSDPADHDARHPRRAGAAARPPGEPRALRVVRADRGRRALGAAFANSGGR
jgi:FAD/FMN-containing dehydrogenase